MNTTNWCLWWVLHKAEDNYAFLRNWFNVFSHYRFHDLWISGESYAGVYVPMLTHQILNGCNHPSTLPVLLSGAIPAPDHTLFV